MTTNNAVDEPTAASGKVLQGQGVGTASAFSTATYPATTTINQVLYSSAANTVSGLTTANSAVLATNGSGVPSITATPTITSVTFGSGTALSVYQEGTFTPTLIGASTAGTTTYSAQQGNYTRIGNMVHCVFCVNITAATGTGLLQFGAFPFTIKNTSNGQPIGSVEIAGASYTFPAGVTSIALEGTVNSTNVLVSGSGTSLAATYLTIQNTGTNFHGSLTYFI
jgi:hypothetical protein